MSIDFSTLQGLTIPEGNVTQITDESGRVMWSAVPPMPIVTFQFSGNSEQCSVWINDAELLRAGANLNQTVVREMDIGSTLFFTVNSKCKCGKSSGGITVYDNGVSLGSASTYTVEKSKHIGFSTSSGSKCRDCEGRPIDTTVNITDA